jgi:phosphate-selective porin OprO/OprP
MQIDFNNPATPEYKDVFLAWDRLPLDQRLVFGNQKRPIGLDHLNSSRFNVFAERPLAVEAFNEDARRIGLAMYGYDPESSLHWRYGVYNLENTSRSGRYIGDSLQMGGYGRLSASPWYDEISGGRGYQHLAIAGSVARPDGDVTAGERNRNEARFRTRPEARSDTRWLNTGRIAGAEWFEQIGVESMTNIGALQLTGEYLATFVQRDVVGGPTDSLAFHGGYAFVSYFLTGEHITYDRSTGCIGRVTPFENFWLVDRCGGGHSTGWGAWQVALRYDYLDLSDSDVLGGRESNYTLGLNWHWTPYSKVQTNLIYGTISDHRPIVDPASGIAYTGGDFWILGSRFMIDF